MNQLPAVQASSIFTAPDRNPVMVYLSRIAPGSRRTMAGALKTILEIGGGNGTDSAGAVLLSVSEGRFPWWEMRYQHTQAIRAALAGRYAPSTANKILAALKGVLKECWRLGYMDAEAYHRAIDLEPVKGERLPRGRALTRVELDLLFTSCRSDTSPIGRRDLALLSVLYGAGLRRQEVAELDVGSYDPATSRLTVSGKGNKRRTVYIKNGQRAALEAWIEVRGSAWKDTHSPCGLSPFAVRSAATTRRSPSGRGGAEREEPVSSPAAADGGSGWKNTHVGEWPRSGAPEPLFLASNGKGRGLTSRGISPDGIYDVCQERARRAGIAPFSPHDLRRSAISDMLDAGADISAVQAVAGHSKIDTTARYDRRGERAKEAAASLLRT
jgi:site-specific recombinase XerD